MIAPMDSRIGPTQVPSQYGMQFVQGHPVQPVHSMPPPNYNTGMQSPPAPMAHRHSASGYEHGASGAVQTVAQQPNSVPPNAAQTQQVGQTTTRGESVRQLKDMFPDFDDSILESVLAGTQGNVER